MSTNLNTSTTLKDLTGTGRNLGALTVEQLLVLLADHLPVAAKAPKGKKDKAEAKPVTAFYADVIVGKREEREARHNVNIAASAWMREKGLVPSGQAWAAVKAGERNVTKLLALNKADSLAPRATKAKATDPKASAPKATVAKAKAPEAEIVEIVEVAVAAADTAKAIDPDKAAKKAAKREAREREAAIQALIVGGFTEEAARAVF